MITFGTAAVPVVELRGAIPLGVSLGLHPLAALALAAVGNMLPVPFIVLLLRQVLQWLKRVGWLANKVEWLENYAHKKGGVVRKYRLLGLMILVAIPLPGTGAWTGALVAALLDIRMRQSVPVIFLGVLIAGAIVTAATCGIIALWF